MQVCSGFQNLVKKPRYVGDLCNKIRGKKMEKWDLNCLFHLHKKMLNLICILPNVIWKLFQELITPIEAAVVMRGCNGKS